MISIIYEGNGNIIDLSNTHNLVLKSYEGLDQPASEIITLSNPNIRGTQYQRSQIIDRLITFTFYVYNVENVRQQLMKVFKCGKQGTLTLKNEYREGQITCYFNEMIFERFSNLTTVSIILRAPYPYFKGLEEIVVELDSSTNEFVLEAYIEEAGIVLGEIDSEHSAVIVNDSEEVGIEIEIVAIGTVVNPIVYNETSNKQIGVNYTMSNGNTIKITTGSGNKKVILNDNGVETNLLNMLVINSTFFQLQQGSNRITCDATTGGENMLVNVKYRDEYEAI